MVNSIDLQPSELIQFQDNPDTQTAPQNHSKTSSFLDALANAENCGMFILMDKVTSPKKMTPETALLVLDLLRDIKQSKIKVHPSSNDHPRTYVAKLVTIAEGIAAADDNTASPLYASATRLMNCLQAYVSDQHVPTKLEYCWLDFLVHFYRDKLYFSLREVVA